MKAYDFVSFKLLLRPLRIGQTSKNSPIFHYLSWLVGLFVFYRDFDSTINLGRCQTTIRFICFHRKASNTFISTQLTKWSPWYCLFINFCAVANDSYISIGQRQTYADNWRLFVLSDFYLSNGWDILHSSQSPSFRLLCQRPFKVAKWISIVLLKGPQHLSVVKSLGLRSGSSARLFRFLKDIISKAMSDEWQLDWSWKL